MDSFETHLFIEFYFRYRNRLNEDFIYVLENSLEHNYGVFQNAYELTKIVYDFVIDRYPHDGIYNVPIHNNWLDEITVDINGNLDSYTLAAYNPNKSKVITYIKDNTKKADLYIVINKNEILSNPRTFVGIMHEIQHGYEDFNRTIKGNENIESSYRKSGYYKNNFNKQSQYKSYVSYILYFTQNFERNAYVAEMVGELETSNNDFKSLPHIINILKDTQVYRSYYVVSKYIDDLINVKDINLKNEILVYFKELSNYKFNTYGKLIDFLKKRKRRFQNKFETIIPKIVYEHLNFNGTFNSGDMIELALKSGLRIVE